MGLTKPISIRCLSHETISLPLTESRCWVHIETSKHLIYSPCDLLAVVVLAPYINMNLVHSRAYDKAMKKELIHGPIHACTEPCVVSEQLATPR